MPNFIKLSCINIVLKIMERYKCIVYANYSFNSIVCIVDGYSNFLNN